MIVCPLSDAERLIKPISLYIRGGSTDYSKPLVLLRPLTACYTDSSTSLSTRLRIFSPPRQLAKTANICVSLIYLNPSRRRMRTLSYMHKGLVVDINREVGYPCWLRNSTKLRIGAKNPALLSSGPHHASRFGICVWPDYIISREGSV